MDNIIIVINYNNSSSHHHSSFSSSPSSSPPLLLAPVTPLLVLYLPSSFPRTHNKPLVGPTTGGWFYPCLHEISNNKGKRRTEASIF